MRNKYFFIVLLIFNSIFLFAQKTEENKTRGTIKIRKPFSKTLAISSKKKSKKRNGRTFIVRYYNYDYIAYFPGGYKSMLFPIPFNTIGLLIVDENRKPTTNKVIGYEYEIFKGNTLYRKGVVTQWGISDPLRELSKYFAGSSVWIQKLYYQDAQGVIHKYEVGEFKVEKVGL
jgi:hypothetical protein